MATTGGAGGGGSAGQAQVVTLAQPAKGNAWELDQVLYGYSAAPAAGNTLTITDGTVTITIPVLLGGMQNLTWKNAIRFTDGAAVTLTLSASSGLTGYIYPYGRSGP